MTPDCRHAGRIVHMMTILFDHDVFDGAPMARFIRDLSKNLKTGTGL
ncbi:MAG: hypothetical protein NT040_01070 [Bacteroidetes bacterium]|nr:hypothetical protein [Bacteroidota bacterium]